MFENLHPLVKDNIFYFLSKQEKKKLLKINMVVDLLLRGWKYREISRKLNVSFATISLVAKILSIKRKVGRPPKIN